MSTTPSPRRAAPAASAAPDRSPGPEAPATCAGPAPLTPSGRLRLLTARLGEAVRDAHRASIPF
ncbi:MAG: hypothetical protein OJJ54_15870 [Pseudonocardia sp.]|nr:hypothetical protein [Pseudonocardia sp.]